MSFSNVSPYPACQLLRTLNLRKQPTILFTSDFFSTNIEIWQTGGSRGLPGHSERSVRYLILQSLIEILEQICLMQHYQTVKCQLVKQQSRVRTGAAELSGPVSTLYYVSSYMYYVFPCIFYVSLCIFSVSPSLCYVSPCPYHVSPCLCSDYLINCRKLLLIFAISKCAAPPLQDHGARGLACELQMQSVEQLFAFSGREGAG